MRDPVRRIVYPAVAATLLVSGTPFARADSAAFRLTAFELRDPHVFYFGFLCADITDVNLVGGPALNAVLRDALAGDADSDGFLDLGLVVVFDDVDTAPGATGTLR